MGIRGQCLCGAVGYEIDTLADPIVHCHCSTCRKAHASAFTSTARVERTQFRWLRGTDRLASFQSSIGKWRHFCATCGSHLLAERHGQSHVILRVATLDDDPGERPRMHIWTSHDVPWLDPDLPIPRYSGTP